MGLIAKWTNFRALVDVASGWKFFYTLAMPVVWCWILFIIKDDKLLAVHLYLFAVVSSLFITNALPLVVSAMLLLVLLPLLGLQQAKMAGENVMREQAMMILGQMALGCAVVICNLHKRMALRILTCTGNSHVRIITTVFFLTLFFSTLISGPTAAFIMLAAAQSMCNEKENITLRNLEDTSRHSRGTIVVYEKQPSATDLPESSSDVNPDRPHVKIPVVDLASEENDDGENDDGNVKPEEFLQELKESIRIEHPVIDENTRNIDKELKRRYFIIIYIAANIGSILLPYTSPGVNLLYDYTDDRYRNIVYGKQPTGKHSAAFMAQVQLRFGGKEVVAMTLLHWAQFALPIVLVLGLVAWLYLLIFFVVISPPEPNSDRRLFGKKTPIQSELLEEEQSFYRKKLTDIGRIDIHQILVLIFTLFVVTLWFTKDPRYFHGWSRLVHDKIGGGSDKCVKYALGFLKLPKPIAYDFKGIKVGESAIVFLFIVIMFVVPRFKKKPSDPKPLAVLGWKFLEGQMFWNVVIMFGCQFAFSQSCLTSGFKPEKLIFHGVLQKNETLFPGNLTTGNLTKIANCGLIRETESGGLRLAIQGWMTQNMQSTAFSWKLLGCVGIGSELFGGIAASNVILFILSKKLPFLIKMGKAPMFWLEQTKFRSGYASLSLPVTALSSLCFMFPVSTATNAIVFSLGSLTGSFGMLDMMTYGFLLDVVAWLLVIFRYEIFTNYEI